VAYCPTSHLTVSLLAYIFQVRGVLPNISSHGLTACLHLPGSWRIAQHLISRSHCLLTSSRFVAYCPTSHLTVSLLAYIFQVRGVLPNISSHGLTACLHLPGSWRIAQHLISRSHCLLTSSRFVTCCSTSRLTTLTCARRRRQKRWRDQTGWEEGFCTVPTASPMWCRRGCSMAQSQRLSTMSRACPHAYDCSTPNTE
jgi:hypothetical protein